MPMKMKICPCCDQPIKGIYCKGCRKIVLNPVERDIRYYLNTRHPEFEHDCTYHDDGVGMSTSGEVRSSQHAMSSSEIEAKKAELKARMLQRKQEPKKSFSVPNTKRYPQTEQARKPLIAVITTVITVFMVFFTFIMIGVINTMNGMF